MVMILPGCVFCKTRRPLTWRQKNKSRQVSGRRVLQKTQPGKIITIQGAADISKGKQSQRPANKTQLRLFYTAPLPDSLFHITAKLMDILTPMRQHLAAFSTIAGSELQSIRRRRLGNGYIFGDFTTDCANAPLFAHKVATIANHMSEFILQQRGMYHGSEDTR